MVKALTDKTLKKRDVIPLTVVIATLGGDILIETIKKLNYGTVAPAEILICIPEKEALGVENLSSDNVKIVRTKCRGQVAQRAIGFQEASNELVLQLDDDIFVRTTCLENMVACISEFNDVAVGPKLYDAKTGKYHLFMTPASEKLSLFQKLLYCAANGLRGYEPGRIGKSGINMGVPEEPANWFDIDWLPGGCVLHRKKNLVLFNYYPFQGKAFAEDLFHSALLKKKGIRLIRCGTAACDVDFSSSGMPGIISLIKGYRAYLRAMTRLARDGDRNLLYLHLYLFLNIVGLLGRKLFSGKMTRI